ncbi:hypothetical protein Emag_007717 [Eimeria magna]
MGLPSLFLFAAASQGLVNFSAASHEAKRIVRLADANTCLTDLNAARHDAGLAALTTKTEKENDPNKDLPATYIWKAVCDTLLDNAPFTPSQEDLPGATPALFALGEGDATVAPQCSDAVKHWRKGYSIFKADPPVDRKVDYAGVSPDGVSFVTLYNPSDGAQGRCVVAACTEKSKTESEEERGEEEEGEEDEDEEEKDQKLNAQSDSKMVSALMCATTPVAFENSPLFTRDQWDKIAKANSASMATASLLTSAALLAGAFSL